MIKKKRGIVNMKNVEIEYTGKNFYNIQHLLKGLVEVKEKGKQKYLIVPHLEYDSICNIGDYIIFSMEDGVRVRNVEDKNCIEKYRELCNFFKMARQCN
jgi:hypothetical protein